MLENNTRTEISQLGEFGLIKHLTQHIKLQHEDTFKGVGDDAAVIDKGNGMVTLVSTDMLVEGIHFDLTYVPLKHLGYKAATVNFSDICAMNGMPKQLLVSIAISSRFPLDAVEELYAGIHAACNNYKVDLVGGDTTSSTSGLVISCTIIGEAKKEDVVYRNGAKEKDLICVTGDLGGAYTGLLLLEREKEVYKSNPGAQPDLEGNDYILERQLKPEARIDVIEMLKDRGVKPTSMIDISDGLASELLHLCTQSELGANLYEEKIPIDPMTFERARSFNLDPTTCAMNGGEDYELLFTIKLEDHEKLQHNPDVTFIGHMTAKSSGVNMISKSNTIHPITAQGWDAFKV
ncbi:MAG TPA: thiamine-phosphate kinase [Bacteroidia bacterium]|jgi:thiamine-monophosphate kinase|nr:thiamine-phosphate kinase [Bacteroidia bacterium]